jgi:hypothetical protein
MLQWDRLSLFEFVLASGARAITRLLLGFFELVPGMNSVAAALASGDEELVREVWVRTSEEVGEGSIGWWLTFAARFQLEVPFRWLLGQANESQLDTAVEYLAACRFANAICAIERFGFDFGRRRPARALAEWAEAGVPMVVPAPVPVLTSVPTSTFLAWHVATLRGWGVAIEKPELKAMSDVNWGAPTPRIDLSELLKVERRLLLLLQTSEGVLCGAFANCEISWGPWVSDSDLKTCFFVLEHPTGQQRKWQLQIAQLAFRLDPPRRGGGVRVGSDVLLSDEGYLCCRAGRGLLLTGDDTLLVCVQDTVPGREETQVTRWEAWEL